MLLGLEERFAPLPFTQIGMENFTDSSVQSM